ncbi:MAG: CoA-binding protein [Bacteroidetes bacterium]|nr:CoA-binding protein [Bacteroidota bacterium]
MEQSSVTRSLVEDFVAQKTLALAGASRSGKKFGNTILKELKGKGYTVHVVHPEASQIDGVPCVPSLAALPEEVGGLVLAVKPAESEKLVREAHAAGISRIWMQQGAASGDAITYCAENGIDAVHGECLLMFVEPVQSVHSFHRWLWKIFGKLPT